MTCATFASIAVASAASVNVAKYHNHDTRDGLYIDPAFTPTAAAALKRDFSFDGTLAGNVYAQPLYIEGGPAGKGLVIAVTESNNVYALDAMNGKVVWHDNVGQPVPLSMLPCGDIDPLGITGTPVVDLPSRTLFLDAMTTPDHGVTKLHLLYALNIDTGTTNSGWPVNVAATAISGTNVFTPATQNQRSALAVLGGYLYVTYSGHYGDCGTYHGWIVGVPIDNPSNVLAWATPARGGGSWSVGGIASDGVNPFIATGNTMGAAKWGGGEALIRFQPGPVFSGRTNDYWAAVNWSTLDSQDLDIGGSGPLIVDVPGATPSALVLAFGKDGFVYAMDRTNLGGIQYPPWEQKMANSSIVQAAATYQTTQGVFVVFAANGNQLISFQLKAASPPMFISAWTAVENGRGSPFVTSTDGTNDMIVWGIGGDGDQRLHAFDGVSGAVIYSGGSSNELMANIHRYSTGIVARGRVFVGADNKVYAFKVPPLPITLNNVAVLPGGTFQFSFENVTGMGATAYSSTDVSQPFGQWTKLGPVVEVSPGLYQFTGQLATNEEVRFYRVTSP